MILPNKDRLKAASAVIVLSLSVLSGCASMTFTQDVPDRPQKQENVQHWHHTIINGMVEVSEPANLYRDCRGKPWKSAEVEFRFKNGFVGGVANAVIDSVLFSSTFLAFYSPWNVEIQCTK